MTEPNKDDPGEQPTRCENCLEFFDRETWPRQCSKCDRDCCNCCAPAGLCPDCRERGVEEMKWQPIKTAPMNGTYIMLAGPSGYGGTPLRIEVGKWCEYKNSWVNHAYDRFTDGGDNPTVWMPLPEYIPARESE